MSQWSECKLEELLIIKHGYAFKGEYFSIAGELILLTPGNIYPMGGLKLKGNKEKFYIGNFPDEYLLHKGDLLIVMTDLTQEASILGGAFLIDKDNKYLHNQRLGLVTHNEKVDRQFLYYYCNWQYFRDQVKASSNGATVKHTAPERIYKCRVNLPPFPIQKKIAAVLSTYDDLIENNNRRIAILEKMAEEIYREWFVRMRFPGHEKVKFQKGVPEGWAVEKIKDIVNRKKFGRIYREKELNDHGKIPVIDQSVKECLGFYDGKPEHKASIENPIILFGDHTCKMQLMIEPFSLAENVIPFRVKGDMPISFLFYLIKNLVETTEYKRHWTELVNKKVYIPDPVLQKEFSKNTDPFLPKISFLKKSIQKLHKLRDLLLSRLLSGKLSVENLDIKFPPGMEEADA